METRDIATRLLQAGLAGGQIKLNPGLDPVPQLANLWKQLRAELKREPAKVVRSAVKKVAATTGPESAKKPKKSG